MSLVHPAVRFVQAEDGRWLAVNADAGCAFSMNQRTRLLAGLLQRHDRLEAAHEAYERASGTPIPFEAFSRNAMAVADALQKPSTSARDQLTFGFTLLPARCFARLAKPFRWLVDPVYLVATAVLVPVLLALCLRGDSIATSMSLYRQGFAGLSVIMASVLFHEIGHAAALLRHGRVVGRLGAGINLIFPALYTEVLEHAVMGRREKLWLNVSGVYFQALFAHLVVLYSLASGDYPMRHFAAIVYLLALFQLLPLNRQDGVWLISDLMTRNGRSFRAWAQVASLIVATALVALLVTRVLWPYWETCMSLARNSEGFASVGAARHASGLAGTLIVMAWAVRVVRSALALPGRRRTAVISSRHINQGVAP